MKLLWIELAFCLLSLCAGCAPWDLEAAPPPADYAAEVAAEAAALSLGEPLALAEPAPTSHVDQAAQPAAALAAASPRGTTVSKAEFSRRGAARGCSGGSCGPRRAGVFRGRLFGRRR